MRCGGFGRDFAGFVGRGVVDDDQFPLLAEDKAWFGLDQEGGEAGRQRSLLVAGRDDHREFHVWLFLQILVELAVRFGHDFVL